MFPLSSTSTSSTTAALSACLLLAACGGGDSAAESAQTGYPETPHEHEAASPPVAVDPPAAQAPAPDPAPAPADPGAAASATPASTETITLAATTTPLVKGTSNATPYWPVWYGNGKPVDGVNCLVNGNNHHHALISIYKDGKRLGFPDGIGRMHAGCYHAYELHVHDVTGIIHMETDVPKTFKLGQWFALWVQSLTRDTVAGLAGPVRYYIIENDKITRYERIAACRRWRR